VVLTYAQGQLSTCFLFFLTEIIHKINCFLSVNNGARGSIVS
jgi:hypothetical protein